MGELWVLCLSAVHTLDHDATVVADERNVL